MPSVEEAMAYTYTDSERASIARNRSRLFVGSRATVMTKLQPMITASQADELMIITAVYDHDARKKSYSLLADAFGLGKKVAASRRSPDAAQRAALAAWCAADPGSMCCRRKCRSRLCGAA